MQRNVLTAKRKLVPRKQPEMKRGQRRFRDTASFTTGIPIAMQLSSHYEGEQGIAGKAKNPSLDTSSTTVHNSDGN